MWRTDQERKVNGHSLCLRSPGRLPQTSATKESAWSGGGCCRACTETRQRTTTPHRMDCERHCGRYVATVDFGQLRSGGPRLRDSLDDTCSCLCVFDVFWSHYAHHTVGQDNDALGEFGEFGNKCSRGSVMVRRQVASACDLFWSGATSSVRGRAEEFSVLAEKSTASS